MELALLEQLMVSLGCPSDRAEVMASQLDKRARQLAQERNQTYEDALTHLMQLMKQGWAAKEKGLD